MSRMLLRWTKRSCSGRIATTRLLTASDVKSPSAAGAHVRLRIVIAMIACTAVWLVALGGSARAQGVSGYQEVTNSASVEAGATVTVPVTCGSGDVVVNGGFAVADPSGEDVLASEPEPEPVGLSSTTWEVTVDNQAESPEPVDVYAICVSSSIPGYVEVTPTTESVSGAGTLDSPCPSGDVVVGGGYQLSVGVEVYYSAPVVDSSVSDDNWEILAILSEEFEGSLVADAEGPQASVMAICVSSSIPGYAEPASASTSVPASTNQTVSASCAPTSVALGGGFLIETPEYVEVDSQAPLTSAGIVSSSIWSVRVDNTDQSNARVTQAFAICAAPQPTVTGVSPGSGPAAGGTSVTIAGTNFAGATAVHFGSTAATSFAVPSSTEITALAPAGSGLVDITVTAPGGTTTPSSADEFRYVPSVTGVSPSSGPTGGGTSVTITGTGFTGASAVDFGSTAAAKLTVDSGTEITATSPAGSGTVNVTVTTPGGTSATSSSDDFSYAGSPTVSGVSPSTGPTVGGTSVTITGTNLTGATAVKFGSVGVPSFTVDSGTEITATSPAGSGTVNVTVTTPGGTSATSSSDDFSYAGSPTVSGVSPSTGPTVGGTSVTITGTNLTGATAVKFGSVGVPSFTVDSGTKITTTSPAGSGTVNVTVTTPGGTSATSSSDDFSYAGSPTVSGVSPSTGPTVGGTSVTITGTNLTGATAVKFGSVGVPSFTVDSGTKITTTSPAGSGTVNVTVTTPGGTSATSSSDDFSYAGSPTVSGVSPSTGPTVGGTSVTITGTNLTGTTAVKFGALPASAVTVLSSSSITAISPAEPAGTVDVVVTTADGSSATGSTDMFTYVASGQTVTPSVVYSTLTVLSCVPTKVGQSTNCTATVTESASGGAAPTGIISFASGGSGSVGSGGTCSLGGSGASASCTVSYTPSSENPKLTAIYGGDGNHTGSSGSTTIAPVAGVTVTVTVTGNVLISLPSSARAQRVADDTPPAASSFVPLKGTNVSVPVGSTIDALAAGASVTVATAADYRGALDPRHQVQVGTFAAAMFQIEQLTAIQQQQATHSKHRPTGIPATYLRLDDLPAAVATAGCRAKGTPGTGVVAEISGSVTKGLYITIAAASRTTVRNGTWIVKDRCDGSLTEVGRGRATVNYHVHGRLRTQLVGAGQAFLVKARFPVPPPPPPPPLVPKGNPAP